MLCIYMKGKMMMLAVANSHPVSNMLNKLHGQPESYDKKYVSKSRAKEPANRSVDQGTDLVKLSERVPMVSLEKRRVQLERLP